MPFVAARGLAVLCLLLPTALLAQQPPVEPSLPSAAGPDAAALDSSAPPFPAAPPDLESAPPAPGSAGTAAVLEPIEVVSRRLNEARTGIETQTGASVYTIDAAAIAAMPGGENALLNQVVLQAPEVAQDSFGQFHVRGEHNGLQYRLNGIILPEGISAFGQTLDPRLLSSMQLITGALPAEYGLRTAGIIDLTTKSGALAPGGSASIYGGSHGTIEPSVNYGGASGRVNYFFTADFLSNDLGIESPDGSSTPLHDRTKQYHLFGYFEDIIDSHNRATVIVSTSAGGFQIPDVNGTLPVYSVNGRASFNSGTLNENQREQTQFAILSWQHSRDRLDYQTSLTVRNSTLQFTPDPIGDLMFNGISQQAYKRNSAYDWQTDGALRVNDTHTLRAGLYLQTDTSTSLTGSLVLPANNAGVQTSQSPETIVDNSSKTEHIESVYVQDEWKWTSTLTLNYGARFDTFTAYASAMQLSPRVNMVWKATAATTVHAGYARYLSPPPFELVGTKDVAEFLNTTAAPQVTQADTPKAERANYTDLGVLQNITQKLSVGLDTYYKLSTNLIDEGQFGAPIILTPFNYQSGRQYGEELTVNYSGDAFSAYGNLSWQSAMGKNIDSAQFSFSAQELAYIANNFIHLDHEQKVTGSAGASYKWGDTRVSGDFLLGSGLRANLLLPNGSDIPNGMHLPYYTQVNVGGSHVFRLGGDGTLTARFDVINLFDREYQIRNGTGVGVGAPQFGPRRGYFLGLAKSL
ncbi:MAG TPA: TonB-dependent receptor [Burkholderiaceae bacterium]|nr:TonB-dependent receptor [Burkholderiaceae bacterium]